MNLDFPGITASLTPELLWLHSEQSLTVLASTVVGGGLSRATDIFNRHVDKNYHQPDPEEDLHTFARQHGITGPYVGFMTAAYVEQVQVVTLREAGLTVTAVVTAGVSNATAAGLTLPAVPAPGTINIILLVDADLTPAAGINAVITATEAKTAVLWQRGLCTADGDPATGTSTDAIAVAWTGRGRPLAYAGPATVVGWLIGRSVRAALGSFEF